MGRLLHRYHSGGLCGGFRSRNGIAFYLVYLGYQLGCADLAPLYSGYYRVEHQLNTTVTHYGTTHSVNNIVTRETNTAVSVDSETNAMTGTRRVIATTPRKVNE